MFRKCRGWTAVCVAEPPSGECTALMGEAPNGTVSATSGIATVGRGTEDAMSTTTLRLGDVRVVPSALAADSHFDALMETLVGQATRGPTTRRIVTSHGGKADRGFLEHEMCCNSASKQGRGMAAGVGDLTVRTRSLLQRTNDEAEET